jgi:HNH endonuclease
MGRDPRACLVRAGWRCEACGVRRRLDVHHVVKRSQGGSDFDLDRLVELCRWCHDQTDAPYERGRLVVTALGAGQFSFEVVQRARTRPAQPERDERWNSARRCLSVRASRWS